MKLPLVLLAIACSSFAESTSSSHRQSVIIDTDIFGDVDDIGALTVANVLHNCGLADVKGIAIDTSSKYGALAASALCTYFGNGDIPIAAMKPLTNETYFDDRFFRYGEYPSKVANNWPKKLDSASNTSDPVDMYRNILESAEDKSVKIISIGFLTNLAHLLQSESDRSRTFSGPDLISSKVSELVVMGGKYPSYPSGFEFNFGHQDPENTAYVLQHWPRNVSITYSGYELGANVFTGKGLRENSPANSPILDAYQWYVGRGSTMREAWDPITTLYGILGLNGFSKLGMKPMLAFANKYGYNQITSQNGSNAWVNDTSFTNQHWLKLADGVTNSSMAWLLDQFLVHNPVEKRCFGFLSE